MMSRRFRTSVVMLLAPLFLVASAIAGAAAQTKPAPTKPAPSKPAPSAQKPAATPEAGGGPQLVVETVKGTIVIQLYEKEAPKSVAQVVRLAKDGFYRSQRVHRVVKGQLVQFGDKQSRDFTLREWWGRGANSGSGKPIGVAEISKTRKHQPGTVAMAHSGDPRAADSQMYITTRAMPNLDGKYTIIGQVTSGLDVVSKLAEEDMIKTVTVREGSGT